MRIIAGTHQEPTGKFNEDKTPICRAVVDSVVIPDEPKSLADFPKGTLCFVGEKPNADGLIGVVTVHGKKFYVARGTQRESKPSDPKPKE